MKDRVLPLNEGATECFELGKLNEGAVHEWRWVLADFN